MMFLLIGYVAIFMVLSYFTTRWHYERNSPTYHAVHDILVSVIWPAHIAVLIWRTNRPKR
jgi:hypothetical protein